MYLESLFELFIHAFVGGVGVSLGCITVITPISLIYNLFDKKKDSAAAQDNAEGLSN